MSQACGQRLQYLVAALALRKNWQNQAEQIMQMREWLFSIEHILDGSWAQRDTEICNQEINQRLDEWRRSLMHFLEGKSVDEQIRQSLAHFLQVIDSAQPHFVQCYDVPDMPRTNNEMEGYIHKMKMRYRRISGRKNWNSYLLRYGSRVAYYEWWTQDAMHLNRLHWHFYRVKQEHWRQCRKDVIQAHSMQRKRYRFCHRRTSYLSELEARWEQVVAT